MYQKSDVTSQSGDGLGDACSHLCLDGHGCAWMNSLLWDDWSAEAPWVDGPGLRKCYARNAYPTEMCHGTHQHQHVLYHITFTFLFHHSLLVSNLINYTLNAKGLIKWLIHAPRNTRRTYVCSSCSISRQNLYHCVRRSQKPLARSIVLSLRASSTSLVNERFGVVVCHWLGIRWGVDLTTAHQSVRANPSN
jgi:hypothetical protein